METKTIIKEITWLSRTRMTDFGWGNGYVVLPIGHKYHGVDYNNIDVDVHGGLTFSKLIDEKLLELWPELTSEDLGKWIVGFDTTHHGDTLELWPIERVQLEANHLQDQLNA